MGRIVISENVSLDGVVQDPTGEEGFRHGGWGVLVADKDRDAWTKVELDEALRAEALLLGRRTYEFFAARFPTRSGELQATAASVVAVTGGSTWEPLVREVFARTPVNLIAGQASRADWTVPGWALAAARTYTEVPSVGHAMMFQQPEIFGDTLASVIR